MQNVAGKTLQTLQTLHFCCYKTLQTLQCFATFATFCDVLQRFCNVFATFLQNFCNISATFRKISATKMQRFCNISATKMRRFGDNFFGCFCTFRRQFLTTQKWDNRFGISFCITHCGNLRHEPQHTLESDESCPAVFVSVTIS
jgi:hypothetical protein